MKKMFVAIMVLAALMLSCNGRKHDIAYYEQKVDSIRKAEQVKEIQQKSGMLSEDPSEAWFDTLRLRTLPIRNVGDDLARMGDFIKVPMSLNGNFGYPVSAKLKAMTLPRAHHLDVIMLAEMKDSITPIIYLYTMNKKHLPLDQLCIYENKPEERQHDFGETFIDYFITSKYEITLMLYYQSHHKERHPELLNSRRYIINSDGLFEETFIEL